MDCEKCDAYLATINDDQALREKTAKLWAELNNVPILSEHINCEGCRVDRIKTVTTCGDCSDMEKCQTVGMVISNNPAVLNTLSDFLWKRIYIKV